MVGKMPKRPRKKIISLAHVGVKRRSLSLKKCPNKNHVIRRGTKTT